MGNSVFSFKVLRILCIVNIVFSIYLYYNNSFLLSDSYIIFLYSIFIAIFFSFMIRKNHFLWMILVTFLYYLYSAFVQLYIENPLKEPLPYQSDISLYKASLLVLCFFSVGIICFKEKLGNYRKLFVYKPYIKFYPLFFICMLCVLVFFFDRGRLGFSYEVKNNPIFEYSFVLFIFLYTASNTTTKRRLTILLVLIYIFEDTRYGGRISSLQAILVALYFTDWSKITRIKYLLFCLSGIILFSFVSVYRNTYSSSSLSLASVWLFISDNRFALDSAANSFYSSLVSISFQNNIIDNYVVESFINFVTSSVFWLDFIKIPSLPEYLNMHGGNNLGGNWFFGYFNLWGGIPVALFFYILMWKSLYFLSQSKKMVYRLSFIAVLCSSPRWFLYSPNTFCKMILVVLVIYVLMKIIQNNGFSKYNSTGI